MPLPIKRYSWYVVSVFHQELKKGMNRTIPSVVTDGRRGAILAANPHGAVLDQAVLDSRIRGVTDDSVVVVVDHVARINLHVNLDNLDGVFRIVGEIDVRDDRRGIAAVA